MMFYNFVNGEYNYSTDELWLPVGLGRKRKYEPKKPEVNSLNELDTYTPLSRYSISEGDRLPIRLSDPEDGFGIIVIASGGLPYFGEGIEVSEYFFFEEAEVYNNILSVRIPPAIAAPFIYGSKDRYDIETIIWEIWLNCRGGIFYYPLWGGRFCREIPDWYSRMLNDMHHPGNLFYKMGDVYGKTL